VKTLKEKPLFMVMLLITTMLFSGYKFQQQKIDKLSLDLISKTLYQGKSVSLKSEVYYKSVGATMVTHVTSPLEKVVITNGNGEYKEYDVKNNSVTLLQGIDLSSKNSLFYSFLSGSISDMGLKALGYKLHNTKIEQKMVITTWIPEGESTVKTKRAEIVHENYLPIYLAFYDMDDKPMHKSFYSNFQQVGSIKMPFTITEFEYISPSDSIITKRTYTNLKTNLQVNDHYLNYKIPSSAKVIRPSDPNVIKK
jgi:outer membrane lipoprotein-sorting protein